MCGTHVSLSCEALTTRAPHKSPGILTSCCTVSRSAFLLAPFHERFHERLACQCILRGRASPRDFEAFNKASNQWYGVQEGRVTDCRALAVHCQSLRLLQGPRVQAL